MKPLAPQPDPLLHKARDVAAAAAQCGGRALLVGGYVRDELLGKAPKDADLEVYAVSAEALRDLLQRFGRVDCVGESFRVYKLVWYRKTHPGEAAQRYELDVSLPRRDRKVGAGHRGFVVEGDPHASVDDAARRRDFTINAILMDPLDGTIIDPVGGRADLEHGLLRAVDAAHFGEDSLRVLRAVQFAARFALEIEAATVELCRSIDLADLPRERIWGEFEKLILKAPRPALGLRLGSALLVWPKLLPELERAMAQRGDELCATIDRAAPLRDGLPYAKQVTLMLAGIAGYLGWRAAKASLDRLGVYTLDGYDVRRNVIVLAGERNRVRRWYAMRDRLPDGELRQLSARCDPRLLYRLTLARGETAAAQWFIDRMETLGVADGPPEPLLMGRHLLEMGMQPGPRVGEITRAVYLRQLQGDVATLEAALDAARLLMMEH